MLATLLLGATLARGAELPDLPAPQLRQAPPPPLEVPGRPDWPLVYERSRTTYRAGLYMGAAGFALAVLGTGAAIALLVQGEDEWAMVPAVVGVGLGGTAVLAGGALANGGAMRGRTAAAQISGTYVPNTLGSIGWACWGMGVLFSPGFALSYVFAPLQWAENERALGRMRHAALPIEVEVEVSLGPTGFGLKGRF